MNNNDFKQLLIQRSFRLAQNVLSLTDSFPNKRSAWIITDQLVRAATSVGANITEAQAASSRKDFINFLNHALKSANETKYWLALSKDITRSETKKINVLLEEVTELAKILGSSILTLKR